MKKNLVFIAFLLFSLGVFSQGDFKRVEFEVSAGLSRIFRQPSLYYRSSGTDDLIDHYSRYYQASYTISGKLGEIKTLFPISLSLNYNFTYSWYAMVGLEYSGNSSSSEKQYQIIWNEMNENYLYNFSYKISSFTPYIGVEKRFSSFGFYANIGFHFVRFSLSEDLQYSENSYWQKLNKTFSTKGKGIGFILGGKYFLNIWKEKKLLLKLEFIYLKTGSLKGEKRSEGESSQSGTFSDQTDGTLFTHETNPFGLGWFNFWNLFESSPDVQGIRDVKMLRFNFSGIRLMIGYLF